MKSSNLVFEEIAFGSAAYRASVDLREAVLRKPLGLAWEAGAFEGEDRSFHLGCREEGRLVASLILKPLDATTLKMRQVAVANDRQSRGIGAHLVACAEAFAAERGYTTIVANAREAALRFYLRIGYAVEGEPFTEVGLPHRHIRKTLAKS